MVDVLGWLKTDCHGDSFNQDFMSEALSPSGSGEGNTFLQDQSDSYSPGSALSLEEEFVIPSGPGSLSRNPPEMATFNRKIGKPSIPRNSDCSVGRVSAANHSVAPTYKQTEDDDSAMNRNRKNAEAARQNRLKKKVYVQGLESDVQVLKDENCKLKSKCNHYELTVERLTEEVTYLRSVLANQSALANLLQNIPNVENVKLNSTLTRRKRSADDHTYSVTAKKTKQSQPSDSGGVCLHVAKNSVSVEFCPQCSLNAAVVNQESESS